MPNRTDALVAVYEAAFAASDGADEGRLVGTLARGLLTRVEQADLRVQATWDGDVATGCIIWTRLRFATEGPVVYLLSPVAVAPGHQGQGLGQELIRRGLDAHRGEGVAMAVTYGSPDYYGRVGFRPVAPSDVAPPHPLSQPEGWLACSLDAAAPTSPRGASRCVGPLDDPAYW